MQLRFINNYIIKVINYILKHCYNLGWECLLFYSHQGSPRLNEFGIYYALASEI
jgi:hypothetical protein